MKSFAEGSAVRVSALLLCAGSGERTKLSYNKVLYNIGKKTVLEYALDALTDSYVDDIYVVINPADADKIEELIKSYGGIKTVYGGDTRTQSVRNGISAVEDCDILVIHDGARPHVSSELINAAIKSAITHGSGVAAVKSVDTVREVHDGVILKSLDRNSLYLMQTPQVFSFPLIKAAYESVEGDYTDDAEVFSLAGNEVHIVDGEYSNRKVTTPADLFNIDPARARIGAGFDVHPLKKGRDLIVGGVKLDYDKGLDGHSDADVLAHAVTDALLSAAGLPDIGVLFPDTDPKYKGADSMLLLKEVAKKVRAKGFTVGSISAVIMAEKPKMAPHIAIMRANIASAVGINIEHINISATTTEHLGVVGEEKGMAASCTCLINCK